MRNPYAPLQTCRNCGAPIRSDNDPPIDLCENCAARLQSGNEAAVPDPDNQRLPDMISYQVNNLPEGQIESPIGPLQEIPDPDRPPWRPAAAIGTWIFSVAAIIIIPL